MEFWSYFRRPIVLFRALRVPVRADLSWFIVVAIFAAAASASIVDKVGSMPGSVAIGLLWTLAFFASIFVHEFAHVLAARLEKLEVTEIVLHPFGGMTRFRHEPETPRAEFRIALAGPAASFLLSVFFVALMAAANSAGLDILALLLFLLGLSNFLLAVFNMFPGYPLDGGRVLRAYLWRSGRDMNEATILTGRAGQVIAIGLAVLGLLIVLIRSELFTGFWAIVTGFFLFDSAKTIIDETRATQRMTVGEVMQLPASLTPDMDLLHFVDHILPVHRRTVFPVAADRQLFGILLLEDMRSIAREKWRTTRIRDAMRPVVPEFFVEASVLLADAREQMRANGIGAVCVVDNAGRLVGFLQKVRIRKR
jgi:Zn-dependent protease/CBS domain-containing protein